MKTTLIIPAWNAENTIKECILSAINALHSPDEILIIDDCSTDKTADIVLGLGKKFNKIKLLKMKVNSGPSAARDYGVQSAIGEVIFFTDSDTIFLFDTFKNCLSTISNYKADAVSGIYHPEPINSGITQHYKALFFYFHFFKHKNPFPYQTFNGQIGAIKKSVYKDVGGYNTDILWGMDYENEEFGYRLTKNNFRIVISSKTIVNHNFPHAKETIKTYFNRVCSWVKFFFIRKHFESAGSGTPVVAIGSVSAFISSLCILLYLINSETLFLISSLSFLLIHTFIFLDFFIFILKKEKTYFFQLFGIHFLISNVISLGAIKGLYLVIKESILKKI